MSKINIVFDSSQYDMFRLCEKRFNYRYNLNKTLPTKAKQLDRGTLVHLACETYYQGLKDRLSYDYATAAALLKVREVGVMESDLQAEDVNRVLEVMEEYFDYWRVADQGFEIVEVEKAFIYLLYEDDEVRVYMAGKIDLITNDNKYTNLPTDHKSFERSYDVGRMGNQFKNYAVATESMILQVNKIGFQKTLKPHEKYLRVPISFDHLILQEWKDNVVKVIFHYLNCVAQNSWPMNETSCDKFNRKCEYYNVCDSSGQEAKEYKLESDFISVDKWDVSAVLKKTSQVLAKVK